MDRKKKKKRITKSGSILSRLNLLKNRALDVQEVWDDFLLLSDCKYQLCGHTHSYPFHFVLVGTSFRWVLKLKADTVRRSTCLCVMDSMGGLNQCPSCFSIEHLMEMLDMFAWAAILHCNQVMQCIYIARLLQSK